jgi:hypothetical protein
MAFTVTTGNPFVSEERFQALKKELDDFQKCVTGHHSRLDALCDFTVADGFKLDPQSCQPATAEQLTQAAYKVMDNVFKGASINGKANGWSTGGMGSRWMDLNAADFGLDYVRAAFYSKKSYPAGKRWPSEKPYLIQITCEKTRRSR